MLETSDEALGERFAFAGSHGQSVAGTSGEHGEEEQGNKGRLGKTFLKGRGLSVRCFLEALAVVRTDRIHTEYYKNL